MQGQKMINKKARYYQEKIIEYSLFLSAIFSVLITISIITILFSESIPFFQHVSFKDIFFDVQWAPLFEKPRYGIWALISGTFLTTVVALVVAIPLGVVTAVFLSEFVNHKMRELLKPIVEILAAVPTVVYGYFALLTITPVLKRIYPELSAFNALSAGLAMGIMIIPYISSLSEDAMRAVPIHLREASLALGASKFQTSIFIILPAAFSGVASAFVLGISRAIGETMIVAIAAGLEPKFSFNIFESTETLTAYIVQVSQGDLPHGSIGYQTIYVCGLALFAFTFSLNIIAQIIKSKFQKKFKMAAL
jgi:phosphate transport system permease protein